MTWGVKGKPQTLVYRAIPDATTRVTELLTGGGDLLLPILPDFLDKIEKNLQITVYRKTGLTVSLETREAAGDPRVIPSRAVLLGEQNEIAVSGGAGGDRGGRSWDEERSSEKRRRVPSTGPLSCLGSSVGHMRLLIDSSPADRYAVSASDVGRISVAAAHQHLAPLGVNRIDMVYCALP